MRILGIDPGTSCGWCLLVDGRREASGTWDLSNGPHEGGGMRFLRLRASLRSLINNDDLDAVAYELVARHKGTRAAHVYGGIVATIATVCEEYDVPYTAIPVGTVKKRATGKGNASKEAMVAAAEKWVGKVESDDEADAIWVACCLAEELEG